MVGGKLPAAVFSKRGSMPKTEAWSGVGRRCAYKRDTASCIHVSFTCNTVTDTYAHMSHDIEPHLSEIEVIDS